MPMVRYFAIKAKLYPTDPDDIWACDSLMDACTDCLNGQGPMAVGGPDNFKSNAEEYFKTLDKFVGILEKRLEGHGETYLIGKHMSAADLVWAAVYFNISDCNPSSPVHEEGEAVWKKHDKAHKWAKHMAHEFKDYLSHRNNTKKHPM